MALVAAARRKADALPDQSEVSSLVRRATEAPSDLSAGEIAHLGDVAGAQAAKVSELLQRLAELVEGERAPRNGTAHG